MFDRELPESGGFENWSMKAGRNCLIAADDRWMPTPALCPKGGTRVQGQR
jgi:hypothetical protein